MFVLLVLTTRCAPEFHPTHHRAAETDAEATTGPDHGMCAGTCMTASVCPDNAACVYRVLFPSPATPLCLSGAGPPVLFAPCDDPAAGTCRADMNCWGGRRCTWPRKTGWCAVIECDTSGECPPERPLCLDGRCQVCSPDNPESCPEGSACGGAWTGMSTCGMCADTCTKEDDCRNSTTGAVCVLD